MKKKLFFVAAMAVLLVGALSCTSKMTPLEKVVKETNELLPEEDNEFIISSMSCDANHVTVTYDANEAEAEFVDYFIDEISDPEEFEPNREQFIPELLGYHFDFDVLKEMVEAGASMTAVFKNDASGKVARLDFTADEVKAGAQMVSIMRAEMEEMGDDEE